MSQPRRASALLDEVTPALHALSVSVAGRGPELPEDLFQVGYEQALLLEPRFDPTRGVKFSTFIWRAVLGAMLKYARGKNGKKRSPALQRVTEQLIGAAAEHAEQAGQPVNVMVESHERLTERQADVEHGMAAAMALAVANDVAASNTEGLDPETVAVRKESARRVLGALEQALAALPSDEDRVLVRRVGLGGEELKAVLAELPGWRERDYRRGQEHYVRLKAKIGEYMWLHVGPETWRMAQPR